MPKVNVYLPDDLAAAVREAGIPVSPVCQRALAEAVRTVGAARRAVEAMRSPDFDPERAPQLAGRLAALMTPRLHQSISLASQLSGAGEPVSTNHLLVGVIDQDDNLGVRLLRALDVDTEALRRACLEGASDRPDPGEARERRGKQQSPGRRSGADEAQTGQSLWDGLTFVARRAFASALEAALDLGHNYLGCEHLLFALCDDEASGAGEALDAFGVESSSLRRAVTTAMEGFSHARGGRPEPTAEIAAIVRRLDAVESRLETLGA
jgi:ATP-dependent Clp protease ATP-binding subunit ClpC